MQDDWLQWIAGRPADEQDKILSGFSPATAERIRSELAALARAQEPEPDEPEDEPETAPPIEYDEPEDEPDDEPSRGFSFRTVLAMCALVGFLSWLTFGHGVALSALRIGAPATPPQTTKHAHTVQTAPKTTPQAKPQTAPATAKPSGPKTYTWAQLKARVSDSVGLVTACQHALPLLGCASGNSGTAWVLDTGYSGSTELITANHVIAGAHTDMITVRFPKVGLVKAKINLVDKKHDIATLTVKHLKLPGIYPAGAFSICGSDTAKVGQQVAEFGYPRGFFQQALSTGKVTAVNQTILVTGLGLHKEDAYTAANIPGESGGPVLNREGCVIGIADAVSSSNANNASFLPITVLHNVGVSW